MSNHVIRVDNLGKKYLIDHQQQAHRSATFRETLTDGTKSLVRRLLAGGKGSSRVVEEFWALKGVSFVVNEGDRIGIIGRNGAGKSTLLKVLSRITEPTAGRIAIKGRVASLLEVGTGFHPELTGGENIYLNGAILGMSRVEIKKKFDEIVAFSEVEKFLDTPVKRYSSGMYVRLAFAVAAHLEPEILIVDEVLAVGDAVFQKKCLGKMSSVAREGRTVVFVSHNMAAVQGLCNRVLWINGGQVVEEGDPTRVVSRYLQTSFSTLTEQTWSNIGTAPGNEKVRLRRACVRPVNGSASDPINTETAFQIEFEYWNLQPDIYLNLSFQVYNEQGVMVFNAVPVNEPVWRGRPFPAGLFHDVCHIPSGLMNNGVHRVEVLVVRDDTVVIFRQNDILAFEVRDTNTGRGAWYGRWAGAVRPNLEWRTEFVEALRFPVSLQSKIERVKA